MILLHNVDFCEIVFYLDDVDVLFALEDDRGDGQLGIDDQHIGSFVGYQVHFLRDFEGLHVELLLMASLALLLFLKLFCLFFKLLYLFLKSLHLLLHIRYLLLLLLVNVWVLLSCRGTLLGHDTLLSEFFGVN